MEEEKFDIGIDKHRILREIQPKESQKTGKPGTTTAAKKPRKPGGVSFFQRINTICPIITISIATFWLAIFLSTGNKMSLLLSSSIFLLQALFMLLDPQKSKTTPAPQSQKTQ